MAHVLNEAETWEIDEKKVYWKKKNRRWDLVRRISAFQVQFDDRQTESDNQFYDDARFSSKYR